MALFFDISVICILILGIRNFRQPCGARIGNTMAAFALLCAFVLVLYRHGVVDVGTVIIALLAGAMIGYVAARAVNMIQIPSMVAFQHGAGGVAAFLVSFVELTRDAYHLDVVSEISGVLGLTIGSLTFSASIIASAKLANKMRQAPHILPAHRTLVLLGIAAIFAVGALSFYVPNEILGYVYLIQIVLSAILGILFAVRVGGADMPVLISFLNATAGLAAALCGMVIGNQLLIAFGATVAASGSILTHVMCKAMNRNLLSVFLPPIKPQNEATKRGSSGGVFFAQPVSKEISVVETEDAFAAAADILKQAHSIIIIPGYGMALAKAQFKIVELAKLLSKNGASVKYAIHPVAGRMPGHMHVILAEAEVEYGDLLEMDAVNPLFKGTDVALVVGACDVVNPAAIQSDGTPISGMPILTVHDAEQIIVCNLDKNPGYSGVANPLYENNKAIMLLGDAKASAEVLIESFVTMKGQDNDEPNHPIRNRPLSHGRR